MWRAPSLPNETSGTGRIELCTVHPWPMGALNYALSRPGRCIQTPKYSDPRCTRSDCSYRSGIYTLSSFPFLFFPFLLYFLSNWWTMKLFELVSRGRTIRWTVSRASDSAGIRKGNIRACNETAKRL